MKSPESNSERLAKNYQHALKAWYDGQTLTQEDASVLDRLGMRTQMDPADIKAAFLRMIRTRFNEGQALSLVEIVLFHQELEEYKTEPFAMPRTTEKPCPHKRQYAIGWTQQYDGCSLDPQRPKCILTDYTARTCEACPRYRDAGAP